MFTKIFLDYENIYDELSKSAPFEAIANGRHGGVLVEDNVNIPIVRTTSIYKNPAKKFTALHNDIINKIKKNSKINNLNLNNALIEIYDSNYKTMGYHTDQSLDLDENSYICIYSCYQYPEQNIRTLKIKNKITNDINNIKLDHNSVVIFSYETNYNHLHKIILDNSDKNNWLGITFRFSKTFVNIIDNIPYINNIVLKLASDTEKKEFIKLRSDENKNLKYKYPVINYTLSPSDLITPIL